MKSLALSVALVGVLAAPCSASAGTHGKAPSDPPVPASFGFTSPEPGPAVVDRGDNAPDVSWESPNGWTRLRELRAHGAVLLVFGADDRELQRLERERARLLQMGVVPAAVLDRRAGACQALARRLQLGFPVVPDPQRVIASQYNTLDPVTRRAVAAWFVVDRKGAVRGLSRAGLPGDAWTPVAAEALNLPAPGVALPTASPR